MFVTITQTLRVKCYSSEKWQCFHLSIQGDFSRNIVKHNGHNACYAIMYKVRLPLARIATATAESTFKPNREGANRNAGRRSIVNGYPLTMPVNTFHNVLTLLIFDKKTWKSFFLIVKLSQNKPKSCLFWFIIYRIIHLFWTIRNN